MERKADATSAETVAQPFPLPAPSSSSGPRLTSSSLPEEGRFVPGTLLNGRYRIIGLIGLGGMGEVYRATDLTLGQSVALKFLPESASGNLRLLERFHGEVRVARQVSHPNVCRVYDIGEADGLPFISMEYIDGEDLASLLQRIGRLPGDKALETARKICAGLAAAHDKGVIHRDLKPQNIMLNKRGEVVIMDFGLAAVADSLSGAEARNGTPAYMAPEQLRGSEVTAKSDLYSLGLVLYELYTGRRPFDGKTVQQLIDLQEAANVTSITSVAADADPAVDKIIRRCLDPDPARRPAGALAVAAALPGGDPLAAALAAGETPSPDMVAAAGVTEGLARKYSLPCLALVLVCLAVLPFLRDRSVAMNQTALLYPPEVLAQKARETAAALGYPKLPKDSTLWLQNRSELLDYLKRLPLPRHVSQWLNAEAPLLAVYRESPSDLLAWPYGRVDAGNPPLTKPGMVTVKLDAHAHLRELDAVPYGVAAEPSPPVTADAVFSVMGFDRARFVETAPATLPSTPADLLRAWRGPHPVIPRTDITVEIGWWKSQVVFVRIGWPWERSDGTGTPQSGIGRARDAFVWIAGITCLVFALLLARRNWKLGRADRRGALRLAAVRFGLDMLVWAGEVHPIPEQDMIVYFFGGVADALLGAAMLWVLYLALEPALRARWPQSIVTWNRVLSGQWQDAQVWAHVLVGGGVGVGLLTAVKLADIWLLASDGLDTASLHLLLGPRHWLAGVAAVAAGGIWLGLAGFFIFFGLRTLLRKEALAAVTAALVFTVLNNNAITSPNWAMQVPIYLAIFAILTFVLLRLGLVATIAAIFFLNVANRVVLTSDLQTWYTPGGLATALFLAATALFAFRQSLGSRELLGDGTEAG